MAWCPGIDRTLQEVGQSVKTVSGATIPFEALEDNDDIRDVLDYISDSLVQSSLASDHDAEPQEMLQPAQDDYYPEKGYRGDRTQARSAQPARPEARAVHGQTRGRSQRRDEGR